MWDRRCIRCGHVVPADSDNCEGCTWPYTRAGWATTGMRVQAITLDTGCVNAKRQKVDLNQLEAWEAAGHFRLQRTDVLLQELRGPADRVKKGRSISRVPNLFTFGVSVLDGPDVLAGPLLPVGLLRAALFPTVRALTRRQQNDIEHLRAHVRHGGDLFVTLNTRDFVDGRKQQALSETGIWVFTPGGAVALLRSGYGRVPPLPP